MKIFILEDDFSRMVLLREVLREHDVFHENNVEDGKVTFEANLPYDLVLLDHDLEDSHYVGRRLEQNTGTQFAQWLSETQSPLCKAIIHSYNPDGAARMEATLALAEWEVERMPFGMTLLLTLATLVNDEVTFNAVPGDAQSSPEQPPQAEQPASHTSESPSED